MGLFRFSVHFHEMTDIRVLPVFKSCHCYRVDMAYVEEVVKTVSDDSKMSVYNSCL